jgi:hypothetical protein
MARRGTLPLRVRRDPALPRGEVGRCLPEDAAGRYEALQWLMFQMGARRCSASSASSTASPAREYEDTPARPLRREARRLLGVLDVASRAATGS